MAQRGAMTVIAQRKDNAQGRRAAAAPRPAGTLCNASASGAGKAVATHPA